MTSNNLCNSCSNYGCEFQSGIVRTECAFYIPPHIESDKCGNYVVMQPTHETRSKNDMIATLDEIKSEITELDGVYVVRDHAIYMEKDLKYTGLWYVRLKDVIDILGKYEAESEESTDKRKIDITTGYDMERVYMEVEEE